MGPKRKRTTDSGAGRPSPHRPADSNLGQHDRGRGGGGGGGGRSARRNETRDSGPSTSAAPSAGSPLTSPSLPRPTSASSHPATTPLNTAVPIVPSPMVSPIQSGYHYDVVTDTRLGRWAEGGRQELVDHGIQSRDDEDVQELSTIFQELLQSCLDFRLKALQAGEAAKEIIGPRPDDADTNARAFDPHLLFLDTISVYLDVESGNGKANLRDFMIATGIDPDLMRRVLEPPVLQQLGLIRETFTKMGIRQATNILYKQANYNLLREETEGYAKLATELFTTCNSQAPSSDAIEAAFERVKGLVGTFDLDVGRVLDVLLDVFASVLIKQNKFFVKLLRISSWWPRGQTKPSGFIGGLPKWALPESKHWQNSEEDEALLTAQRLQRDVEFWNRARDVHLNAYFELGGRQLQASNLQRVQGILDGNDGSLDDLSHLDPETQWTVATKTLPPQGNRVAAQLLGFKLRFYASNFRVKKVDVIPANLYYMTALLIKIGFISLADLWPHLAPDDEKMQEHRDKREKIIAEEERRKTGKVENALTMAVLSESDPPGEPKQKSKIEAKATETAKEEEEEDEQDKFPPQKVQLLTELLTMGAIPEALYILARYPWLLRAYPDLINLINRLLSHSIQKVFEQTRIGVRLEIPSRRLPDIDQTGVAKGSVRLGQTQQRRPLRWPHPDGEKDNSPYRFYWEEWADNVPICQTVDDVFTLCDTLLNLSGVNIGRDAALLTKLAMIGAMSLAQDQSPQNMGRWLDLSSRLLVPALSLTEANSFAVHAVWDLLKLYPTTTRYSIYSDWYLGRTSRIQWITSAFARTRAETNSSLKRLSLTNLSTMAKKLAKIAYSSPGTVFKTAFDQIEAYPNLIQAFVECARYFPDLGYDVLNWSLMSALGGKSRSRTQEASILLTSKWLQALSKFSGRVFKRYQNMKPSAVLQYVNSQLLRGSSTDLVILRELILSMAGVVSDVDFTDTQIWAMTGGETLRRQTLIKLGDRRFESVSGSKRLMQSLIDTKLAGRLLINLAQYRQSALYQDDAHVKYLGTILDEVQQALAQYLDLLRSNLSPDEFDSAVPGIAELMKTYGLDVSLAFMIGRASLAYRMANTKVAVPSPVKDGRSSVQPAPEVVDPDGDLPMNGIPSKQDSTKDEGEDKMVLDERVSLDNQSDNSAAPAQESRMPDPIADVIQPLVDTIQDLLPSDTWQTISPEFFVTFWSLSLGDLHVPQSSYDLEHDRLNKELHDLMRDRSDMSRQGVNRKEEKKQALQRLSNSVRDEMSAHINRYQKTKFRLTRQAKFWFPGPSTEASVVADALLEQCVIPRIFMSAPDTEYCFRLVKFLHENQTPNFRLFAFYEQLFNANRLRSIIFCATVREAEHIGRFIKCILEDLGRWHADKNVYEKEALGPKRKLSGFATAFDEEGNPTTFIEHPFFRDAHYEWHKNLNIALKACLQGTKEWMHIRNALTVVKWVHEFFPAVNFMGSQMLKVLDDVKKREEASKDDSEEHRVDLSVAAQTVYAMLKRRDSKWVSVQAFRPNMVSMSNNPTQVRAAVNNTQSGMPQDGPKDVDMTGSAATTTLRPTAPEFKPTSVHLQTRGAPIRSRILTLDSNVTSTQTAEEEDGEVKDGKDSKNSASAPGKAEPRDNKSTAQEKGATKELASREKLPSQSSRPATPKPVAAAPAANPLSGARGEASRPPSAASRLGGLPHSLPNRPDVPIPGHFRGQLGVPVERPADRPAERRDAPRDSREPLARETRDRRDPRELAREPREPRDSGRLDRRDPHDLDRRPMEPLPREPGRLSDRDSSNRSESSSRRGEILTDRESRPSRDRAQASSGREHRGLREQPVSNQQSQSIPAKSNVEEPPINPQRAALFQADDQSDLVKPQHAAVVQTSRVGSSARSPRDNGRDRISSRTSSPRRDDRQTASVSSDGHGRDDRHSRRNGSAVDPQQQPPRDIDQSRDSGRPLSDRSRDLSHQGLPPRPHESDRGRSNQQDPNYGRLSAIPSVTDTAPQGPRGRGARNSRISSMPTAPRSDGRMPPPDLPRAQSPDRQPPTGPASTRGRRSQSSQYEQNQAAGGGGGAQQPIVGMHPDRIRQFETGPSGGPVHPDVPKPIASNPPPPPPGGPPHSRPNVPTIHTNDRVRTPTGPSGSRHSQSSLPNTPVMENNAPYSAPTGPAASSDRQRNGARRQLDTIQNSIVSNRRDEHRRQRASMPDSDAQILTGASPVSTPIQELQDPMRRNPLPENQNPQPGNDTNGPRSREPSRSGAQNDEISTGRGENDRGGRRDHRERGERSSRHGGRERSPRGERDSRDTRGDNHERHERRPPAASLMDMSRDRDPNHEPIRSRDPNLEPIQPRRSNRDLAASNNNSREILPGSGRDPSIHGRDSRHRGDNRGDGGGRLDGASGGRIGDEWTVGGRGGSGGSMRGGPRDGPRDGASGRLGGDERRDPRGDERTSSRKRRSDVAEMPLNDREKRLRR